MLKVNHLAGFGAGGDDTIRFLQAASAGDATNLTTYTFSAVSLDATSDYILVGVSSYDEFSACKNPDTVTVDGNSCTKLVESYTVAAMDHTWWGVALSGVASADVVVTHPDQHSGCIVFVYSLSGSKTPSLSQSNNTSGTTINWTGLATKEFLACIGQTTAAGGGTWTGDVTDAGLAIPSTGVHYFETAYLEVSGTTTADSIWTATNDVHSGIVIAP